jgi:hypothetical protein
VGRATRQADRIAAMLWFNAGAIPLAPVRLEVAPITGHCFCGS